MLKQVAPLAKPKARAYFGIDAKVYGHMGHVDPSALKVLLPTCVNRRQWASRGREVGRLLERAKQSRGGRTTGKREHGKGGLRCAVGCMLAVCWILIGSCCVVSGTRLMSTLCCPSSAPVLPCLPPPRQRRCPRPATSTRARRLSTTLTTAGPPPRPRAAKLLPGLVCRACLSRTSAAPTLDSLVDTIQLLVPALPAHTLSTGRGRRAGLHIPT